MSCQPKLRFVPEILKTLQLKSRYALLLYNSLQARQRLWKQEIPCHLIDVQMSHKQSKRSFLPTFTF